MVQLSPVVAAQLHGLLEAGGEIPHGIQFRNEVLWKAKESVGG